MRIITLRAENVKRLRAVEITPDGNTVVIAGRNAQGKSSVLDAIWMALAGGSGAKETTRPIRDGEDRASVCLDLGDLVVTRKWTSAGTTLEVAAPDGARYGSPQTVLDGLIGRLSFDPLAFAQQDPKRQRATLLEVLELPFDPDEVEEKRRRIYDERTLVNRDIKRLEAQLVGLPAVPADTPDEETSAAAIAQELQAAQITVQMRDDLEKQIADAEQRVIQAKTALANLISSRELLPDLMDPEPIRERLATVDATNAAVRAKHQATALTQELAAARAQSEAKTAELGQIDQASADAIANASMPLDGLSFDAEGVLFNGLPFSQASAAERLRVGIAMAMALNPKIRVIRITDGSLLDSDNLALIEEMAGANDFQIWIERVDETGSVGVTIEDGQVAAVTAEAVA